MKSVFVCALLIGSLGSFCSAQQSASCMSTNANCPGGNHAALLSATASLPPFGPVLLPNSGKAKAASPKAEPPTAGAPTVRPATVPVQAESLGEIARRYRLQKAQQGGTTKEFALE
jgi:hypothetical protein